MRDYLLYYDDVPRRISEVETWRLEAIASGERRPQNRGLNGITLKDLVERVKVEPVARSLPRTDE